MQLRRIAGLSVLFCFAAPLTAPMAAAPAELHHLDEALARLHDGQSVLLRTILDSELEGLWRGGDAASVRIESAESGQLWTVPREEIAAIWQKGRATAEGAKTVGISVAVVGAVYGTLMAAYLGDFDDDDGGGFPPAALVPFFAVSGGALGAVTGALIGSGFTRWRLIYNHPLYPVSEDGATAEDAAGTAREPGRPFRFSLIGGYTEGREHRAQSSLGVRAAILTDWRRHWAIGPEIGYAHNGYSRASIGPGYTDVITIPNTLHAGGVAYLFPIRATISPYIAAGFGLYLRDDAYVGYSLGGGLEILSRSRGSRFLVDLRYHDNITHSPAPFADLDERWPAFVTAGLGFSF